MPAVHIRNLDDAVIDALKKRAAANQRSLEGELRCILTDAVAPDKGPAEREPLKLHLKTVEIGAQTSYRREESTKPMRQSTLLDTNVLVDATDLARPGHHTALRLLETCPDLFICAQVAREYLVVATRATAHNGLGFSVEDALANLSELRRAVRLLPEEKPLLPALLQLLREVECYGALIHDALLVATMLVHNVHRIVTSNLADFERFADRIEILSPTQIAQ